MCLKAKSKTDKNMTPTVKALLHIKPHRTKNFECFNTLLEVYNYKNVQGNVHAGVEDHLHYLLPDDYVN